MTSADLRRRLHSKRNKDFMTYIFDRSNHTSFEDIKSLKEEYGEMVPVFIYDSFMKGGEDADHFKDMAYFGPATTVSDEFVLVQNAYHSVILSPIPLVMNHFALTKQNARRIQGELYGVPLDQILWLDKVYDNEEQFTCDRISVMLHQTTENSGVLVKDVLCYFGEPKAWTKMVHTANSVKISPNVITSQFLKDARVYRTYRNSPVKLPADDPIWMDEAYWNKMGYDGYGGM